MKAFWGQLFTLYHFSWRFDCKNHSDSLINMVNRQRETRHVMNVFQSEKPLGGIDMLYQNFSPLNSGDGLFSAAEKFLTAWHLEVQRCFLCMLHCASDMGVWIT